MLTLETIIGFMAVLICVKNPNVDYSKCRNAIKLEIEKHCQSGSSASCLEKTEDGLRMVATGVNSGRYNKTKD